MVRLYCIYSFLIPFLVYPCRVEAARVLQVKKRARKVKTSVSFPMYLTGNNRNISSNDDIIAAKSSGSRLAVDAKRKDATRQTMLMRCDVSFHHFATTDRTRSGEMTWMLKLSPYIMLSLIVLDHKIRSSICCLPPSQCDRVWQRHLPGLILHHSPRSTPPSSFSV